MKRDLDAIMEVKGLDALLVSGAAAHNPAMYYFTGNVHISEAELVKLRGQQPQLFCNGMEREEAALSGLPVHSLAKYNLGRLAQQAGGDMALAYARRYQLLLSELGFSQGRLSVYGEIEAGQSFAVFTQLQQLMPEIEIVGEIGDSALLQAMETKDADEIEHMRQMGQVTVEVVDRVARFLQGHKARDGRLVKEDGSPLTIGEVKSRINLWAAELGVGISEPVIVVGNGYRAHLFLGGTVFFHMVLSNHGKERRRNGQSHGRIPVMVVGDEVHIVAFPACRHIKFFRPADQDAIGNATLDKAGGKDDSLCPVAVFVSGNGKVFAIESGCFLIPQFCSRACRRG